MQRNGQWDVQLVAPLCSIDSFVPSFQISEESPLSHATIANIQSAFMEAC